MDPQRHRATSPFLATPAWTRTPPGTVFLYHSIRQIRLATERSPHCLEHVTWAAFVCFRRGGPDLQGPLSSPCWQCATGVDAGEPYNSRQVSIILNYFRHPPHPVCDGSVTVEACRIWGCGVQWLTALSLRSRSCHHARASASRTRGKSTQRKPTPTIVSSETFQSLTSLSPQQKTMGLEELLPLLGHEVEDPEEGIVTAFPTKSPNCAVTCSAP